MFTKGKTLERNAKDVPQVLISLRGRHSEKPNEIRKRIVRLFGDVPRLKLFARQNSSENTENIFDGWDVFGNQVDSSIAIH
ncbi:methyltransferase-A70 family protein [Myroides odoratimimus]|uniref:hypothetical protein n=1 Tax=Myroides odoratimimus TaxID=76832 RepID=UPI00384D739C